MLILGLILVVGGLLIKFLAPMAFPLGWIIVIIGALILIFSIFTKRK